MYSNWSMIPGLENEPHNSMRPPPPHSPKHDALTLFSVLRALWHEFSVEWIHATCHEFRLIWQTDWEPSGADHLLSLCYWSYSIHSNDSFPFSSISFCFWMPFWSILDHFNWEVYHFLHFFICFPLFNRRPHTLNPSLLITLNNQICDFFTSL